MDVDINVVQGCGCGSQDICQSDNPPCPYDGICITDCGSSGGVERIIK